MDKDKRENKKLLQGFNNIILILVMTIIIFTLYIIAMNERISNLELKILRISHELDYTKGLVEDLSK